AILFKIAAQVDTAAWSTIDKGFAAQGGVDQMAKMRKTLSKAEGHLFEKGQEGTYESEVLALYPDRLRQTVSVQLGRRTVTFTLTRNGEKAWKLTGGRRQELNDKSRREM